MSTILVSHHPEENPTFHPQTYVPFVASHAYAAQNDFINITHGSMSHQQQQPHGHGPGNGQHMAFIFQSPNIMQATVQGQQQQLPVSPHVMPQLTTSHVPNVLAPAFVPQASQGMIHKPQQHFYNSAAATSVGGSIYYVNEQWASSTQVMHQMPYLPNSTPFILSPPSSEWGSPPSSASEYSGSEGGVKVATKGGSKRSASSGSSTSSTISRRKSPVIVDGSGLDKLRQQELQQKQQQPQQQIQIQQKHSVASTAAKSKTKEYTNVYIRGLAPNTTDPELCELVSGYGSLISSKAIIDRPTNSCKGFGFAKFSTYSEAEKCIEGLKAKHYEAGFARDSFNSKLKELSDHNSTNLYVSNLPTKWTEENLVSLFEGYEIKSNRMLRDDNGASRGVAFVRFPSRTVCDMLIDHFNGINLNVEGHFLPLQVRYADTVAQKRLKAEQKATHKTDESVRPAAIFHHKVWTRKQVHVKTQVKVIQPLTPPSSPQVPAVITEEIEDTPEPKP